MSHYIGVRNTAPEILLSGGTSGTTLRAINETGFDLYCAYRAADLYMGSNGSGERDVPVTHELAREAFLDSLAWALALLQCGNDEFGSFGDNRNTLDDTVFSYVDDLMASLSEADAAGVQRRMKPVYEQVDELDLEDGCNDTWKRSLSSIEVILRYTQRVYEATEKRTVYMFFC